MVAQISSTAMLDEYMHDLPYVPEPVSTEAAYALSKGC